MVYMPLLHSPLSIKTILHDKEENEVFMQNKQKITRKKQKSISKEGMSVCLERTNGERWSWQLH
jgi:hypothetical protein